MKKLSKAEIEEKIKHQREKQREYAKRQLEQKKEKLKELKEKRYSPTLLSCRKKELTEEEKQKKIEKAKETQRRMRERAIEKAKNKPLKARTPIKHKARKRYKGIDVRSDFCIMPADNRWETKRRDGLERHEVFGAYNRYKSIEDGLVIFLTPEQHKFGKFAIHRSKEFREYAQRIGMLAWMQYYNKTREEFFERYGKYAD